MRPPLFPGDAERRDLPRRRVDAHRALRADKGQLVSPGTLRPGPRVLHAKGRAALELDYRVAVIFDAEVLVDEVCRVTGDGDHFFPEQPSQQVDLVDRVIDPPATRRALWVYPPAAGRLFSRPRRRQPSGNDEIAGD